MMLKKYIIYNIMLMRNAVMPTNWTHPPPHSVTKGSKTVAQMKVIKPSICKFDNLKIILL